MGSYGSVHHVQTATRVGKQRSSGRVGMREIKLFFTLGFTRTGWDKRRKAGTGEAERGEGGKRDVGKNGEWSESGTDATWRMLYVCR